MDELNQKFDERHRAAWAQVVDQGLRRRHLDMADVLDAFPNKGGDLATGVIEEILLQLTSMGVEVVEAEIDGATIARIAKSAESSTAEVDALRQYMREATRHRILTREEEVEIARRMHFYQTEKERLAAAATELQTKAASVREMRALVMEDRSARADPAVRSEIRRLERQAKRLEADSQALEGESEAAATREREARHEFITNNLRLVIKLARQSMPRAGIDFLDLIQAGNVGMMRALDRFDETRGFKFSTFATHWVRQAISLYISDHKSNIRVPIHMNDQIRKMRMVEARLREQLGRDPTNEEIVEDLGDLLNKQLSVDKLDKIRRAAVMAAQASLNAPVGDEENGAERGDLIADMRAPDPERELIAGMVHDKLEDALEELLNPRERRVVQLRFGLIDGKHRTLEEVGKRLNVTRERVRQIEARALFKLRSNEAIQHIR